MQGMENLDYHVEFYNISFSRPQRSWNFSLGHGKSWKMMGNDFWGEEKKNNNTTNEQSFSYYF